MAKATVLMVPCTSKDWPGAKDPIPTLPCTIMPLVGAKVLI